MISTLALRAGSAEITTLGAKVGPGCRPTVQKGIKAALATGKGRLITHEHLLFLPILDVLLHSSLRL